MALVPAEGLEYFLSPRYNDLFSGPQNSPIGLLRWRQWKRTHLPMKEMLETQTQSLGPEDSQE